MYVNYISIIALNLLAFVQLILTAMLALTNSVVALAEDEIITRLINKNLIGLILPFLNSTNMQLRLLTLWILGNIGTSYFKDFVVRPIIVNTIVSVRF